MTVRTFADLEAVARGALANANIATIATRWYSAIPDNPTWPLGLVQRVGGVPAVREAMDAANIQIDVYGTSKSEARTIAAAARTVLMELAGTSVTWPVSAWISAVEDSLGLLWQPDNVTSRDRYIFAVTLYGR